MKDKMNKIKRVQIKTLFNGWKDVTYEQAKNCVENLISGIVTKSNQEKIDYINTEKIKGITVNEVLRYERQQEIIFKRNITLWENGILFAEDRIKNFYNKQKATKSIKYMTIKEIGEKYSKRIANLMFKVGYGEWVFRDYGILDKMQKQMIEILQYDDGIAEVEKELLFEQIKGNILENEIDICINNKETYTEFVEERLENYLQEGWLKQNEFDFLNSNLTELSEKCFTELRDDMSLEEELEMVDKNIRNILEGIAENIGEER